MKPASQSGRRRKPRDNSLPPAAPPRPRIGAHMSIAGGHDRAVEAAVRVGCEAFQVFTKNTNQWAARPLSDEAATAFRRAVSEAGLAQPVAHNSYLINLASPDEALWTRSIEALVIELERAEVLGIEDLVCHPGAHMGQGEAAGLERVAEGARRVIERTAGLKARIVLESTAGQGTCLGHRVEHLGEILNRLQRPERTGVCLDSCHLFAAGYPLGCQEHYNELIDALDRSVGIVAVRVWHLNDSVRECGSRVDRHAGIGAGRIGREPFRWIVTDRRFAHVPMILETPKGLECGQDRDTINLSILRNLWSEGHAPTGTD